MIKTIKNFIYSHRLQIFFLSLVYVYGVYLRLAPRLAMDAHQLTLNADIWERLSIAEYFLDHCHLPKFCLRYIAYGNVPLWYPPISPIFFASLSKLFSLDIPTISSRVVPFIEALTPLPFFFLGVKLFNKKVAYIATGFLSLTPSFIYWSGISDPQSLTLFLLPIYILFIIWRSEKSGLEQKKRWAWILGLGVMLAINFLTHLTYFLAVFILLFVSLGLLIERKTRFEFFIDLLAAILASQVLTLWWWQPNNLYWWWVKALVTSSGLYQVFEHFKEYGVVAAIIGLWSALFLLILSIFLRSKRKGYAIMLLFWALLPFLETQNETILVFFKRMDLAWSTVAKPLEGFRFYCFLAQPFSLMFGLIVSEYILKLENIRTWFVKIFIALMLILLLIFDMHFNFNLWVRLKNSGITVQEYKAAAWFKNNSKDTDRIIADYYRVQMFAGVCGGKSLLGGLFPLRNVNFPYIKSPAVVQEDVYRIYKTSKPQTAYKLMKKYNCTHIFYSKNMNRYGALGSKFRAGFGVDINMKKFKDERFFEEVYNYTDNVIIIKLK